MGPHASPLRAHPPSIPRPGTLSQLQPTRRAAATQARTAAGPKAQGVGGGRGGAAAAEAAAAPGALAKRLRRPRAESALSACRCDTTRRDRSTRISLIRNSGRQRRPAARRGARAAAPPPVVRVCFRPACPRSPSPRLSLRLSPARAGPPSPLSLPPSPWSSLARLAHTLCLCCDSPFLLLLLLTISRFLSFPVCLLLCSPITVSADC